MILAKLWTAAVVLLAIFCIGRLLLIVLSFIFN